MDHTTVLIEIATWPVQDRLALLDRIWDDLVDSGWRPPLTDELRAELDRRLEAAQKNPNDVVTWEQVVEHVRRPR